MEDDSCPYTREKLIELASELGIYFKEDTSDRKLCKLIKESVSRASNTSWRYNATFVGEKRAKELLQMVRDYDIKTGSDLVELILDELDDDHHDMASDLFQLLVAYKNRSDIGWDINEYENETFPDLGFTWDLKCDSKKEWRDILRRNPLLELYISNADFFINQEMTQLFDVMKKYSTEHSNEEEKETLCIVDLPPYMFDEAITRSNPNTILKSLMNFEIPPSHFNYILDYLVVLRMQKKLTPPTRLPKNGLIIEEYLKQDGYVNGLKLVSNFQKDQEIMKWLSQKDKMVTIYDPEYQQLLKKIETFLSDKPLQYVEGFVNPEKFHSLSAERMRKMKRFNY